MVTDFVPLADGRVARVCGRCGGSGNIPSYGFIYGGVCFACNGNGTGKSFDSLAALEAADARNARAVERAAEKRAAEAAVVPARVAELVEAHPLLAWLTYTGNVELPSFVVDVAYQLQSRGTLSEVQLTYVQRAIESWTERSDARIAEAAAAEPVPVTGGRIRVSGVVVSTRSEEGQWGWSHKMLLKDDRGFKLWGSVPSTEVAIEPGTRVAFDAAVERSESDPLFGFYKRPTKVVVGAAQEGSGS